MGSPRTTEKEKKRKRDSNDMSGSGNTSQRRRPGSSDSISSRSPQHPSEFRTSILQEQIIEQIVEHNTITNTTHGFEKSEDELIVNIDQNEEQVTVGHGLDGRPLIVTRSLAEQIQAHQELAGREREIKYSSRASRSQIGLPLPSNDALQYQLFQHQLQLQEERQLQLLSPPTYPILQFPSGASLPLFRENPLLAAAEIAAVNNHSSSQPQQHYLGRSIPNRLSVSPVTLASRTALQRQIDQPEIQHQYARPASVGTSSALSWETNQQHFPATQQTSRPALDFKNPLLLYRPSDDNQLSEYQCFIRKQIEFFAVTPSDLALSARGRNKPISIGQVGIRCIHCSSLEPSRVSSAGSRYYPSKLESLYQAAQNIACNHLCSITCNCLPQSIKERLNELRDQKTTALCGKAYWAASARALNVKEVDGKLQFASYKSAES